MLEPVLTTVVSALCAAIAVMWKRLSAEHARLSRRSDDCEEDRKLIHEKLGQHERVLAVFQACGAGDQCPARQGLQRSESFRLSISIKNPTKP
jgi:hypothetical protein